MELQKFICRASQVGKIMTNGRKKDTIGQTAISYLQEWIISEVTGKRKVVTSKYLDKGIAVEAKALERVSKVLGKEVTKNTERLTNDYFTGEWDAIVGDTVIDVKSSWDVFTFPYFQEEINKDYYYQLQTYMDLTGANHAILAYCLEDAPEDMIEKRAWQIAREAGEEEPTIKHWSKAEDEMTFKNVPDNMRIKFYQFDRDEEVIQQMKDRVEKCREIIETQVLIIK